MGRNGLLVLQREGSHGHREEGERDRETERERGTHRRMHKENIFLKLLS